MYEIISLLKESALFKEIEIIELIDEETIKLIKLKSILFDESILFITELYTENIRKYSYHWQNNKNELITRWDNQPHWKNIETFPHHKHEKNKIMPSDTISVEDIINIIKTRLK